MSSRNTVLAVATSAVIIASGCGGSKSTISKTTASGSSGAQVAAVVSEQTKPLTHDQLVAKATAICNHAKVGVAGTLGGTTPQQFAEKAPMQVSYERTASVELARLTPPASLQGYWRIIVMAVGALADDTSTMSEYARTKDKAAANVLFLKMGKTYKGLEAAAERVNGLHACTQIY